MLDVLKENDKYGQCLINANYTEDINTSSNIWMCNVCQPKNKNDRMYITHWHNPHKFLCDQIYQEVVKNQKQSQLHNYLYSFSDQLYWPDYSLRPGITRMEVFKNVGKYDENANHFEMDFAFRYYEKGWRTAFLFGCFQHSAGKRTYQRNDPNLKNAYQLNDEAQFGEKL